MAIQSTGITIEETIVGFATTLRFDDLPDEVVHKQKQLILDQVGIQMACTDLPWVKALIDYVEGTARTGPSSVVGTPLRLVPEAAALVNGTGAHGFELDDYYPPSHTHPSCVTVPAAIAMGESVIASGRDVIVANAAASELMVRLAHATNPSMLYERGFHATCAHGVFGSAVAAGVLLGLDQDTFLDALGIAGSHASGTTEYTESGGDTKRLHGGLGASAGIRSALLARNGFTGPRTIIGGTKGFLAVFSPKPQPQWLFDIGSDWRMLDIATKPYCCNARITPQINALAAVLSDRDIDPDDIAEIRVGTDRGAFTNRSATTGPEPDDILGMQFSTHVAMGLRTVTGSNGFDVFYALLRDDLPQKEKVTEVARRVRVDVDEESQSVWPDQRLAKVTVTLTDGTRLDGRAVSSKDAKPGPAEIRQKFLALAERKVSPDAASQIADMIDNLEQVGDINEVGQLILRSLRT